MHITQFKVRGTTLPLPVLTTTHYLPACKPRLRLFAGFRSWGDIRAGFQFLLTVTTRTPGPHWHEPEPEGPGRPNMDRHEWWRVLRFFFC